MHEEAIIHGSCVAIGGKGVLLLGEPGTGKSDLVLRLLDQPGGGISGDVREATLVADDQVAVRREGAQLIAAVPAALAGKLEIRGLGIVAVPVVREAPLVLAVRLTPHADIERMPELEQSRMAVLGLPVALVLIDPDKASAPARIRAALDHIATA